MVRNLRIYHRIPIYCYFLGVLEPTHECVQLGVEWFATKSTGRKGHEGQHVPYLGD